jgi:hypothetical protein
MKVIWAVSVFREGATANQAKNVTYLDDTHVVGFVYSGCPMVLVVK